MIMGARQRRIEERAFVMAKKLIHEIAKDLDVEGIVRKVVREYMETVDISAEVKEIARIEDLKKVLEKIAPMSKDYEHCKKWGDCNGYAHIRSSLLKPFLAVPIEGGKLLLGTWQQIAFIDFDNRPRNREISVKIIKG